jgi:uroporphyrinogen decarboxylase
MNKKERVDAALRGDQVDRIPASMWGHDFEREWGAQSLAEAMVENFTRYDWDYMKVNPRASYHVEGWGVKVRPSGEKYVAPILKIHPLKAPLTGNVFALLRLIKVFLANNCAHYN